MSSRSLELEKVSLALMSNKLRLEIAPTVDIKFPYGWSPDDDCSVKALTSGSIWVSRGRRCRVDVEILFNSQPLDVTCRTSVLESLGYHLRDAHIWSQLSLSSSLEVPQSRQLAESSVDVSVYINNAISPLETQPKAWLLNNIDVKAPDSVLCAEFERLHVQLCFHQIQKKPRTTTKRVKSSLPDPNSPESMLLNYISGLEADTRIKFFETVAAVLPDGPSSSIAKCFDNFKMQGAENSITLPDKRPHTAIDKAPNQTEESVPSPITASEPTQRIKGQRYSKETVNRLRAWLDAHPGNMFPTNVEILDMMKQTGLERVYGWFKNQRRNKRPPRNSPTALSQDSNIVKIHLKDDDMLLSQLEDIDFEDEMLFDEEYHGYEEDEMLLSQTPSSAPSLTSQLSTLSTVTAVSSTHSSKRPASEKLEDCSSTSNLVTLPVVAANQLMSFALRTVIAGPSDRKRDLQGIQMEKIPSSTSLSSFVPSMFCPGFKELMAHNSKFLPTISNAICSSWVRNVQGVVLRQRLLALSNAKVSEYHDGNGDEGSSERLVSVLQGRLWRMMQRTIYNEDSIKKLWKKCENHEAENIDMEEGECDDDDLLGENRDNGNIDMKEDCFKGCFGEELRVDDEELLLENLLVRRDDRESDEGLLDYFEEQERLTIEAETEEMLLGGDRDRGFCNAFDDEDELFLLEDRF